MADDPPFDLSKFDPSTLDLSFLHPAEQNRIRNRQFNAQELSLLLSGQNPWTESGKPKPLPSEPKPKPTPPPRAETPEPELPQAPNVYDLLHAMRSSEFVKFWAPRPGQEQPTSQKAKSPESDSSKPDWTQTRKPTVRRHRANESPPPAHTNPNEFLKPNRGWFLAAAGVVAVWALYKIDAPLWLGLTTLALLIACAAVWPWIEKSRIRQRVFWISLTLYAIGACVVVAISTRDVNLRQIDSHATSPTPIPGATQLQIIQPLPSQTPKQSPTPFSASPSPLRP